MDTFGAIVLISLTVTVLALLAIGKWSSRSASDIQNKDRLLRWGVQFEIEKKEIPQMLEAQAEYRRRRARQDRGRAARKSQASGPTAGGRGSHPRS
jgi:hypothetical protein